MSMDCSAMSCPTGSVPRPELPKGCCPSDALPCPTDAALGLWKESACQAMKEVQVEMLKSRIKKAWGPKMEKVADAVVESMEVTWQSWVAVARAKGDLRDRFAKIHSEGGQ